MSTTKLNLTGTKDRFEEAKAERESAHEQVLAAQQAVEAAKKASLENALGPAEDALATATAALPESSESVLSEDYFKDAMRSPLSLSTVVEQMRPFEHPPVPEEGKGKGNGKGKGKGKDKADQASTAGTTGDGTWRDYWVPFGTPEGSTTHLPSGWEMRPDSTGRTFYHNEVTGQTQYDAPIAD